MPIHIPYSLDITPPSFISSPSHFAQIRCEGIFISNLSPPPNHWRTLLLRQTRGRLELTVPPYIECSYLLASDTPTRRLAMWQQVSMIDQLYHSLIPKPNFNVHVLQPYQRVHCGYFSGKLSVCMLLHQSDFMRKYHMSSQTARLQISRCQSLCY